MIKKLQKKFIFSAMLAITILLVILLGTINIFNAYTSHRQNEQTLNFLLNNETMMQPPPDNKKARGFMLSPVDENSKIASVYFTIHTDHLGNIISVDTNHIADVSEEDAIEILNKVKENPKNNGTVNKFLYKTTINERDNTITYLFLKTSVQTQNILRVLLLSILAGMVCWGVMLMLIILLSKKAIQPVAENIERQKQFVTDAGHEIKTPLAIILSNTEAMELYNGESKWSKNIKEQIARLTGLTQNLLTLAKYDEADIKALMETVSISEMTENITEMFSENAASKDVRITKNIEQNITCSVNKELFLRLISILIDNAVKYSNQNGEIDIHLHKTGKGIKLEISNTCDLLPKCPANKLFDRFYRADSARTQKGGGYGIGLSAAKSIIDAHGGSITAEYKKDNIISFIIEI